MNQGEASILLHPGQQTTLAASLTHHLTTHLSIEAQHYRNQYAHLWQR